MGNNSDKDRIQDRTPSFNPEMYDDVLCNITIVWYKLDEDNDCWERDYSKEIVTIRCTRRQFITIMKWITYYPFRITNHIEHEYPVNEKLYTQEDKFHLQHSISYDEFKHSFENGKFELFASTISNFKN